MGPAGVVLDSPAFDDDLRNEEAGEFFGLEQFVAEPAVEALDERVLPAAARFDVAVANAVIRQ